MAMHGDGSTSQPQWVEAAPLAQLRERGPMASKLGGRQVALFVHEGEVLACNNRCPHEGYPLCEGALDGSGNVTTSRVSDFCGGDSSDQAAGTSPHSTVAGCSPRSRWPSRWIGRSAPT